MTKKLSVTAILTKKYKILDIPAEVKNVVGTLPDPFTMIVGGQPKNGKTSFVMWLCKRLAAAGYSVFYSSREEGDSKTIQDAYILANMEEVKGKVMLGDTYYFDDLWEDLERRGSAKVVVIDSIDYMKLTLEQFKKLTERFKTKCFIIVCWGKYSAGEFMIPEDYFARKIKYRVGTVVRVRSFTVESRGRYGPTEPLKLKGPEPNEGDQLKIGMQ